MPGCSASACNCCERLRLNSPLCMPRRETVRESRMREICMSGLKRAGAAGLPAPPLLYRGLLVISARMAPIQSKDGELSAKPALDLSREAFPAPPAAGGNSAAISEAASSSEVIRRHTILTLAREKRSSQVTRESAKRRF